MSPKNYCPEHRSDDAPESKRQRVIVGKRPVHEQEYDSNGYRIHAQSRRRGHAHAALGLASRAQCQHVIELIQARSLTPSDTHVSTKQQTQVRENLREHGGKSRLTVTIFLISFHENPASKQQNYPCNCRRN